MNIAITQPDTGVFTATEDLLFSCSHENAYIEPPCCDGAPEEGRYTCGCRGQSSVVCPAIDCTGIQDYEIDQLMERLQ